VRSVIGEPQVKQPFYAGAQGGQRNWLGAIPIPHGAVEGTLWFSGSQVDRIANVRLRGATHQRKSVRIARTKGLDAGGLIDSEQRRADGHWRHEAKSARHKTNCDSARFWYHTDDHDVIQRASNPRRATDHNSSERVRYPKKCKVVADESAINHAECRRIISVIGVAGMAEILRPDYPRATDVGGGKNRRAAESCWLFPEKKLS
jgi:hypothetical protein